MKTIQGHHRKHCRSVAFAVPPATELPELHGQEMTISELTEAYSEVVSARLLRTVVGMPDPMVVLVSYSNPFRGTKIWINTGEYIPLRDRIKRRLGR